MSKILDNTNSDSVVRDWHTVCLGAYLFGGEFYQGPFIALKERKKLLEQDI